MSVTYQLLSLGQGGKQWCVEASVCPPCGLVEHKAESVHLLDNRLAAALRWHTSTGLPCPPVFCLSTVVLYSKGNILGNTGRHWGACAISADFYLRITLWGCISGGHKEWGGRQEMMSCSSFSQHWLWIIASKGPGKNCITRTGTVKQSMHVCVFREDLLFEHHLNTAVVIFLSTCSVQGHLSSFMCRLWCNQSWQW